MFFYLHEEEDPSEENKHYFVSNICELMRGAKKTGEMVFDTPIDHYTTYAHTTINPPLVISFAPSGLEADDLIIEKLYAIKDRKNVCIVSNDRELIRRARDCEVKNMSCKKFITMLEKKNRTKVVEKKPSSQMNSYSEKLEEIFTKRLNQIDE